MRFSAVALAGALALSACGDDAATTDTTGTAGDGGGSSSLSGTIAGAGSSAQTAAMQAWLAGFSDANPDAVVNYDPVGSSGGREQFLAGGTSFAGSDAYLDDEELAKAEERCGGAGAIDLPVYISPIAIAFNLEGIDTLNMSPAVIAGIFAQEITTWNDEAIAADNPDVELPDSAITPVNRSDGSGTTENFTDFLSQTAPDVWTFGAVDEWPVDGGEQANGTSGVVQAIGGGDGTIGYADASQVGDLGEVSVGVGDEFVAFSPEAAAAVVDASTAVEGRGEFDLAYDVNRTTEEAGVYPIVLISYAVACLAYEDTGEQDLVKAFLTYVASPEGQEAAAGQAGSAPLSDTLTEQVMASIDAIGA